MPALGKAPQGAVTASPRHSHIPGTSLGMWVVMLIAGHACQGSLMQEGEDAQE